MTKLRAVAAMAVEYPFARHFGGADKVPASIAAPSSHFQRIKRLGQYATFVCVADDDGTLGFGECFGLPSPKPSEILINDLIAPAITGRAFQAPADVLADWRSYFAALGNIRGAPMEALSGLDIALWDLLARRQNNDLASQLGGSVAPVATYASPIAFTEHPDRSIAAAKSLLDLGFTDVKLKIGRDLGTDLDHVRAVRDFLPTASRLMLDANCAFAPADAARLLDHLAGLEIAWLEEPLPPTMLDDLAALAGHSAIPLAAGENEFTGDAFEQLLVRGGIKILQPNITRAGGVSGLLAVDALARQHDAVVSPHGVGAMVATSALLHTCTALKSFSLVEANRLLNPLRDDFGIDLLPRTTGYLTPPAGPGHGGAPDWRRVAEFAEASVADRFLALAIGSETAVATGR